MHLIQTTLHRGEFEPLMATRLGQAAMMTLRPGGSSDDEVSNEHPRSEQWLYVITGSGVATVVPKGGGPRQVQLKPGSLLVIERGERHQIRNSSRKNLQTLNFYLPPAYRAEGTVLPRAKRK
jgi:mannose-6-phosphate isomerase-like protein (cupin superfamily)